MTCASSRYLGAPTPFGVITAVEPRLYNPSCTLRDGQGSETVRPLARLIALGVRPARLIDSSERRADV